MLPVTITIYITNNYAKYVNFEDVTNPAFLQFTSSLILLQDSQPLHTMVLHM